MTQNIAIAHETDNPEVSVIICTHTLDRYEKFSDCVHSVLNQTIEPEEIILISDGDKELYEQIKQDFGEIPNTIIEKNKTNRGVSYSRNRGARIASSEIIAFIDDDAVADKKWIETLLYHYERTDAVAIGGDVKPNWQTEKPSWFPEEFYWLVGVVEPGFAEHGELIRNAYGSNISYQRDVFLDAGGYDTHTGRKGNRQIQAHEAPVGIKLEQKYDENMLFVNDAIVYHTLLEYRSSYRWLANRSFWQGYSKHILETLYPDGSDTKQDYLKWLLSERVRFRLNDLLHGFSIAKLLQLINIFVFTALVGIGYVYGKMKSLTSTDKTEVST